MDYAYPHDYFDETGITCHHGMTLRDWFAGQALAGLAEIHHGMAFDPHGASRAAYEHADAMLEARKLNVED